MMPTNPNGRNGKHSKKLADEKRAKSQTSKQKGDSSEPNAAQMATVLLAVLSGLARPELKPHEKFLVVEQTLMLLSVLSVEPKSLLRSDVIGIAVKSLYDDPNAIFQMKYAVEETTEEASDEA